MAEGLPDLRSRLIIDTSDLSNVHSRVQASFKGIAGVAAGALAGLSIGSFFKGAIDQASDLGESASKVGVVFGQSAGAIQQFAATAASSLGQSTQQALEATGTFGNLFIALGIGQAPAADMSQKLVTLAGDLASFNNVSPDEALLALRSGLVGETEPLRKFGVNLNDATLRAEAMKLGLGEIGSTLTPQQKAMASYSLILQQTKTAQGDFARTSGGLANQTRILSASFKDLEAKAGAALAPALAALTPVITQVLTALEPVLTALGTSLAQALQLLAPIFTQLAPPVTQIIGLLGQILVPVAGLIAGLAPIVALALQLASVFLQALLPAVLPLIAALNAVVRTIGAALQPVIAEIIPIIQENAGVYVSLIQALLPLIPALGQIIVALLPLLPPLIELATLQLRLIGLAAPLIALLAQLAALLIGKLAEALTVVVGFIRNDLIPWFERIPQTIGKLPGIIAGFAGDVVKFFTSLPRQILEALGKLDDLLINAGKQLIEGLINGIRSNMPKLGGIVKTIAPFIAGLKGPIEKDRVLLVPAGHAIMEGLSAGIHGGLGGVQSTIDDVNALLGSVNAANGAVGAVRGAAGTGGGSLDLLVSGELAGTAPIQLVLSDGRVLAETSAPFASQSLRAVRRSTQ